MRIRIIGNVELTAEDRFTVPMPSDHGMSFRRLEFTVGALTPACAAYPSTLLKPHRVASCGDVFWLFQGKVITVEGAEHLTEDERALEVVNVVLQHDKRYQRLRRSVESYENMSRVEEARREAIPDDVRLFVWQRDQGRCVRCGSVERLEFDHVIAVAKGGSSTARNIQLLCERCNREKGSNI